MRRWVCRARSYRGWRSRWRGGLNDFGVSISLLKKTTERRDTSEEQYFQDMFQDSESGRNRQGFNRKHNVLREPGLKARRMKELVGLE